MAISQLERDTLAKAFAAAKTLLQDLEPRLKALDNIYNSVGGVKETLSQAELDALPELSGLTKAQLDDGIYAMTALILPGIQGGYSSLAQLAARFL